MITEEEMTALMVAIKNRYGLDFTNYEKGSLRRGVVRLMMKNKLATSLELWSRVLKDKDFFISAIDDLLVNLTELFRNPDVWQMLSNKVLPELSNTSLNVWHAGCSTGEEVYTFSIVLEEKGWLSRTKAIATDLSSKALAKAKKGEYSRLLLKQYLTPFLKMYPNRSMEDYFVFDDTHATIKSKYKNHVNFLNHNLVHDSMPDKYDIIFCRNVMIYFDDTLKTRVLDLLERSLKEGGFLIIGYYDIMPDYGKKLFDLYDVRTRIYKKKKI